MSACLRTRASLCRSVTHRPRVQRHRLNNTTQATAAFVRCFGAPTTSKEPLTKSGPIYNEGEVYGLSGNQYEAALLGNYPDPPTAAPFGTLEKPALIYSGKKSRIVGCVGGGHYIHRLYWFTLVQGPKHVCSQCGQVFQLVNDKNWEELKDQVQEEDPLTKEQHDYFQTIVEQAEGKLPAGVTVDVGPHSKF